MQTPTKPPILYNKTSLSAVILILSHQANPIEVRISLRTTTLKRI